MLSKIADIVAITFPKTKFAPEGSLYRHTFEKKKKFQILKLKRKGYLLLEEAKEQNFSKIILNY